MKLSQLKHIIKEELKRLRPLKEDIVGACNQHAGCTYMIIYGDGKPATTTHAPCTPDNNSQETCSCKHAGSEDDCTVSGMIIISTDIQALKRHNPTGQIQRGKNGYYKIVSQGSQGSR